MEQVVVLVKPDGVRRGLTGEIIRRFEQAGLKLVALKMVWNKAALEKHYSNSEDYLRSLGEKTLKTYREYGRDAKEDLGTEDTLKLGKMIRKWLLNYVGSGPVVAMLLVGRHAVGKARTVAGPTMPIDAPPGTIRGDFSADSAAYANLEKRGVNNIVHVSGSPEEAEFERKLWFREKEIYDYKRSDLEE